MTQKLINDTSETRRAKMNMITVVSGSFLMFIGLLCFIIKGLSVEYVDETGLLHENFFLVGIGYLFLLCGVIVIIGSVIHYLIAKKRA